MILVGEMRDLETISTALTAAETGHLVFATLHTQSAPQTIDRIIDVFPPEQQGQVRVQLASTLQGVVTQNLIPTADGRGRIAALEILLPDDAVRNLIRQGKVEQIYSVMQTNTQRGMQTMEQALADLTLRRVITPEAAFSRTTSGRPASRPARERRLPAVRARGLPERAQDHYRGEGVTVVDFKKEIKLSDLFRRPVGRDLTAARSQAAGKRHEGPEGRAPRRGKSKSRELVGIKVGASQLGRCARRQQRLAASAPAGPAVAAAGDRRRRRGSRRRGARRRAERVLQRATTCRAAACGSGIATNHVGVRSFEIAGIEDERQLANAVLFRAHDAVSIPVDEAIIDYRVAQRGASTRAARSTGRSCSSPPTASRSSGTSWRSGRPGSSSSASTSRRSHSCGRSAPRGRGHVAERGRRRRQHRARAERRSPSRTAGSASSRASSTWGGSKLAAAIARELPTRHVPRPRSSCRASRSSRAGRRPRWPTRDQCPLARPHDASSRRLPASSSRRSSTTRVSRDRFRSPRSCSPAERAAFRASRPSSSG